MTNTVEDRAVEASQPITFGVFLFVVLCGLSMPAVSYIWGRVDLGGSVFIICMRLLAAAPLL